MDLFSNVEDWNPQDLLTGGIIGASLKAKARKVYDERSNRPKPGKYCVTTCAINDNRCTPCLEIQKKLADAIYQLERLENYDPSADEKRKETENQNKITKCTLCGAPIEKGKSECPYCGTAYPSFNTYSDIPQSGVDRSVMIMEKAEEAWNILYDKLTLDFKYMQESVGADLTGKVQRLAGGMLLSMQGIFKQNASEIKQGADYYNVPMSQYINGVALGYMKTPRTLAMEAQSGGAGT